MDLIGCCRAFVGVSETGGFTAGAAAARIPQPVASRRIAALERHLGSRLFDRSTRRAQLTQFGRDMLPLAKRLVQLADTMEHDAAQARRRPLHLAVPETCGTRALAELGAEAHTHKVHLRFQPAPPGERTELVRTQQVRAAISATPDGMWTVRLGLSGREVPSHLEALRVGRSGRTPRQVWIQPEDDVPHVRDRLFHIRDAVGLRPSQVAVADSLTSAATNVYAGTDLLLCSEEQAADLNLDWRPIGEAPLARGYDITAALGDDAELLRTRLKDQIARCLGAEETAR